MMDIDLRKTATDAAYIVVGAGVLGFQQAQVRRRDARAKLGALRAGAWGSLGDQADALKAQADGLATGITATANTVGGQVRDQAATAAGMVTTIDPHLWLDPVVDDLKARVEPVVEQLKTVSVPDAVQVIPTQVTEGVRKALAVGKSRVQRGRGAGPEGTAATSA